ncbi:hypothetical protein WG68_05925 [Arsukibacterium ikkense]|uniref:Uncharacterized protein n=1 Tax=Arsukibacterium ikkense TaxID=336831 RepID=A0A0M2V634_9GAMM|nr:hypothetical protein WG68_05925 [Arsukibacterium ikkense]
MQEPDKNQLNLARIRPKANFSLFLLAKSITGKAVGKARGHDDTRERGKRSPNTAKKRLATAVCRL